MYKFSYYREPDENKVIEFMKEQSFAMVIGMGSKFPAASQLPLEVTQENGKTWLTSHLMRNTDHHKAFEKNNHVLAIFSSPHAFIDANWYKKKAKASTVNYMAVHAQGIIHFLDEAGTRKTIEQITNKHIGKNTEASYDNLPEDYIQQNIKAIIGFRIEVTQLDHVFKLSQNYDAEDRASIVAQLEKRKEPGDLFIAHHMKKQL